MGYSLPANVEASTIETEGLERPDCGGTSVQDAAKKTAETAAKATKLK